MLEVIYEVQVGIAAIDLTSSPPRSEGLPRGAVCFPRPELSDSSHGEKLDAGGEGNMSQPQRPWEKTRFQDE